MNIVLITSEYPTTGGAGGGLGTYTAKIAKMLREEGHRAFVCTLADTSGRTVDGPVPLISVRRRKPLPLLKRTRFFWRYEAPIRRYLDSRRLFFALTSLDKEETIDVVHLASFQSPGLATAGSGRWPTITRFSSLEWLWRKAYGGRLDASERLLDGIERRQAHASTLTCSPSAFLADKVRASISLTPRIVRTPPPIPSIDGSGLHNRTPDTVAFVGSCNRIKGFDLFLEAIEILLANGSLTRFEIAGRRLGHCPSQGVVDRILTRFPSRVTIHGLVEREVVNDIFRRASCIVIPSRVDNYPNVCLEAQAHGCPTVVSRHSSLDEMVTEGIDGFFFENGSSESLVKTLNAFLNLPEDQREQLSRAALQTSARRRDEEPMQQLVSLYEDARSIFWKHSRVKTPK